MSAKNSSKRIFSIGIDAGGSKTRACAGFSGKRPSKQYVGPGGNPSRIGFEKSVEIFRTSIDELWDEKAEESDINLVMGVAGIEGSQLIPQMETTLLGYLYERSRGNLHTCRCMTDIMLIGAMDLPEPGGLSIIIGTGSSFYLHDLEGKKHQGGGWGYILGDEGSGYGISKRAIQHIMRTIDGKIEDDFTRSFLNKIEGKTRPDVVNFVYQDQSNFHHLVRWVIEQSEAGDAVATKVIRDELDALINFVIRFIEDRSISFNKEIVLNGGLAKNPYVHAKLVEVISDSSLSSCSIQLSNKEPAEGAWQLGCEKAQ